MDCKRGAGCSGRHGLTAGLGGENRTHNEKNNVWGSGLQGDLETGILAR